MPLISTLQLKSEINEKADNVTCWEYVTYNHYTAPLLAAEHFRFWPSGVELPATGRYVGAVPGDLPHSTQDVPVHLTFG